MSSSCERFAYDERDTARFIYESLDTLDKLINDCSYRLSKGTNNKGLICDFLEYSDCLFKEYLNFRNYYSFEIPRFTKEYNKALSLSRMLFKSGLISKKSMNKLKDYARRIHGVKSYYIKLNFFT